MGGWEGEGGHQNVSGPNLGVQLRTHTVLIGSDVVWQEGQEAGDSQGKRSRCLRWATASTIELSQMGGVWRGRGGDHLGRHTGHRKELAGGRGGKKIRFPLHC